MVGEAVAKSGAFSKSDEMLQAIASYTTQQTRMGLSSANVGKTTPPCYPAWLARTFLAWTSSGRGRGCCRAVNSSIAAGW